MEGTLQSKRAQPGLPGLGGCCCCCSVVTEWSCSEDRNTTFLALFTHYGTTPPQAGNVQKEWVCLTWGGLSVLPRAPEFQHSSVVLCMLGLPSSALPTNLRSTHGPDRSPLSSLGQLQKGSVQRAPLQPVTCPSYLSLHCQLMYSNRQVGDRAGRRRIDAEM